ncbi:MAG: shikimate dehydrogenase [Anaerolineae bacterium]|nr:shikimate dehydrogenase [Anaerolineae bacterium]MDW8067684.1 shikimate dehydrogenase [Anaerolineae bacterium]
MAGATISHSWPSIPPGQPMVNGSTRLLGVIGWPVAHTLSPAMQNAALAARGLNYIYVPLPVPPERLPAALYGLPALGFVGVNVTVPHKEAVLPYMAELTPIAMAVGAVNTIVVREDGSLLGDNTDGAGFLDDLRAHGIRVGESPDEAPSPYRRALIVGAGGAARAVAYVLAGAGMEVAVVNRTLERALDLCATIRRAWPEAPITAHPFPSALARLAPEADLIVNATSLGLHEADPLPWDPAVPFLPRQVVYDLIYTGRTPFLALAEQYGARAIGGLGMLIYQGARAFELWTGVPAPVEVMAAALEKRRNAPCQPFAF